MSNRIIFNNKKQQYDIKIGEDSRIDTIAKNFIHELITDIGTSVFDKTYGTTFILDLGELVNMYKVDFYLQEAFNKIKSKHKVERVSLSSTHKNHADGFLELNIELVIEDAVVSAGASVEFAGIVTTETIIEGA